MIDTRTIVDVEFETVVPVVQPEKRQSAKPDHKAPALAVPGLSILRGNDPGSARGSQPDDLSPSFLLFTAIAAFAVFFVCGGRFLLY